MSSHLLELITMHDTAAPVNYSPGKGHGDMWSHDTAMHHHDGSTAMDGGDLCECALRLVLPFFTGLEL